MKKRVLSMLLALVLAFSLCISAFAAEDSFEAESEPAVTAFDDVVVLGDASGVTGYSHIGIGSMHRFVIGLKTDYVLTSEQADVDEIQYTYDPQTGIVTGEVAVSYVGSTPLVVTVTKVPGSYPVPLKIVYDPIDLLKDADTAPKYTAPGELIIITVNAGYELIPDKNYTVLKDSSGFDGRELVIQVSESATEVTIRSKAPAVTPTPEPTATPEPSPDVTPEPSPSTSPEPEPNTTPEPTPSTSPEPEPSNPVPTPPTSPASGAGWAKNSDGAWFYFVNGEAVKTTWVMSARGIWYFMDENGVMVTGVHNCPALRGYYNEKTGKHDTKAVWPGGLYFFELTGPAPGRVRGGWQEDPLYGDVYANIKHDGRYGMVTWTTKTGSIPWKK